MKLFRRGNTATAFTIFFLLLAGLVFRFVNLFSLPPSLDESYSLFELGLIKFNGWHPKTIFALLDAPGYSLILGLVGKLNLDHLLVLRTISVVAGMVSICILLALMRSWIGGSRILAATLLLSVSPLLVYWSREARPYALSLLCQSIYLLALYRAVNQSKRYVAPATAAAVSAIGLHTYSIVVIFSIAMYWLIVFHNRQQAIRTIVTTVIGILLLSSPLLYIGIRQASRVVVNYWHPANINIVNVLADQFFFVGLSGVSSNIFVSVLYLALLLIMMIPFLLRLWNGYISSRDLLLFSGFVPPLCAAAAGLVTGKDLLYFPRAFAGSAPLLFAGWVVFAGFRYKNGIRYLNYLSILFIITIFLGMTFWMSFFPDRYYRYFYRQYFAEIADQVTHLRNGSGVVAVHHWLVSPIINYYLEPTVKVMPLGLRLGYDAPPHLVDSAIEDTLDLPKDRPVLLLLNDFANRYIDTEHQVLRTLEKNRHRLRSEPCTPLAESPGFSMFCSELILFSKVEVTNPTKP